MKRLMQRSVPIVAVVLLLAALFTALNLRQASAHHDRRDPAHPIVQTHSTPAPTASASDGDATEHQDSSEAPNDAEVPYTEATDTPVQAGNLPVTEAQAQATALAANSGMTVVRVDLSDENGTLVYSVELSNGVEVKVDAHTGTIVGTD